MKTAVAERVRQHRARQRAGQVLITVRADETSLVDKLIEAQLLEPTMADDRAAITSATTRLIEIFATENQSGHRVHADYLDRISLAPHATIPCEACAPAP